MNVNKMSLLEIRDTDEKEQLVKQNTFDSMIPVPNFAVPQLKLVDFAMLPRLIHDTHTSGPAGNIYSATVNHNAIRTWYPDMFRNYNYVRFDLKYTLVITPTFNHTGLIAMSYAPDNLISMSRAHHSFYPWYCLPSQRVFARVGVDNSISITIPWFGSVGALKMFQSSNVPIDSTHYMYGSTFQHTLRLDRMSTVAAAASAVQTVGLKLYVSPVNIRVGGFLGGNRI